MSNLEKKAKDIKKEEINEIIVLSHFQNRKIDEYSNYFPSEYKLDEESEKKSKEALEIAEEEKELGLKSYGYKFEQTYIKDEEIEKNNIKNTELFVNKSLNSYYKIDKNKINEIFNKIKIKVPLKGIYILSNEKIFTFENIDEKNQIKKLKEGEINDNINNINNINNLAYPFSFFNSGKSSKQKIRIYNNHDFSLINEVELEDGFVKIYQKDLGFVLNKVLNKVITEQSELSAIELDNKDIIISSYDKDHLKINIYQYNKNNNNYILIQKIDEPIKNSIFKNEKDTESYKKIKKLSGNRFMTTLNDLIKIYSSNENKMYEVIFSYDFDSIKDIYEIDEKSFIFFTYKSLPNHSVYQNFNSIHAYSKIYDYYYAIKKIKFNKVKPPTKVLFDLKQEVNYIKLTDYVILKENYILIGINENLYIFSIKSGNQLKKYTLLEKGEKNNNLFKIKFYNIYKWNCPDDNEFIMNVEGNITLFKLNEKENEVIDLTIINYSYIESNGKLIKMNENNQFCIQCDDYLLIY